MAEVEQLAARLRQAVQGCVVHIHGPVQAWAAIGDAVYAGRVKAAEVFDHAIGASNDRLVELRNIDGAPADDPRVRKEMQTIAFLSALRDGSV